MQAKISAETNAGAEVVLKASNGGILYLMSAFAAWSALGYHYSAMATVAVASLVVRPSTVAMATLYNNSGSKVYVIDRVFAHNLVPAAQCVSVLWVCIHPVGMTAPTNDITVRNSGSGLSAGAEGIFDNGATVVADGWFPWGQDSTVVTATTPGGIVEANVAGRLVVPPRAAISMQVVSSVVTSTFCGGFAYWAVPDDEVDFN